VLHLRLVRAARAALQLVRGRLRALADMRGLRALATRRRRRGVAILRAAPRWSAPTLDNNLSLTAGLRTDAAAAAHAMQQHTWAATPSARRSAGVLTSSGTSGEVSP